MKASVIKAAGLLGIITASAGAQAYVVFNNFAADDSFKNGSGWGVDRAEWQACQFVSGGSGRLEKLTIALSWVYDPSEVIVTLHEDNAGKLGQNLRFWKVTPKAKFGNAYTPIALPSTDTVYLVSGRSYWISISTDSTNDDVVWNLNSTNSGGGKATSADSGATWKYESRPLGAMRVEVQGVPEPATIIGIGVGALALLRRRKR